MSNNNSQTHSAQSQTINADQIPKVIRLRADESKDEKGKKKGGIKWKTDVIDNENMNKKKTKICCIFHPREEEDEEEVEGDRHSHHDHDHSSSSSDSSSSESENEKDLDFEERRRRRIARRHQKMNNSNGSKPNAYEVQPDYTGYQQRRAQKKNSAT